MWEVFKLAGLAAVGIGLIGIVSPLKFLKMNSQWHGVGVMSIGMFMVIAAVSLDSNAPSKPSEAVVPASTISASDVAKKDVSPATSSPAPSPPPAPSPIAPAITTQTLAPSPAREPTSQAKSGELTVDAVKKLAGIKTITKVELVGGYGPDYRGKSVHVYYPLGAVWNEDQGIFKAADNAVVVFERLFIHPDIYEVLMIAQGEFTDNYGRTSTENTIRIAWTRATAEKVQWENYKVRVAGEPELVYKLARYYNFHGGYYREIKDKRGLQMTGGSRD